MSLNDKFKKNKGVEWLRERENNFVIRSFSYNDESYMVNKKDNKRFMIICS